MALVLTAAMHYENLHPLQMVILSRIMTLPHARFRDLKIEGLSTDHLTYHIKTLVKLGLLQRSSPSLYTLTDSGKEYVGRIDEHTATIETQGKRGALVRCMKKEGRKTLYLVNRRLKQPFFGYVGFHTGKIKEGESVYQAAARELSEEAGIQADLTLVAVFHYIDFKENGDFLRDIYFYVFNGENVRGELINSNPNEGVENFWITLEDLKKQKTFPGFWQKPMFLDAKKRQTAADCSDIAFREVIRVVKDF
jgi:8-oxo-dGTP pyrophosphatase MutT (NUDIX family)/DNA-binding HxlR family transcriptional regulator